MKDKGKEAGGHTDDEQEQHDRYFLVDDPERRPGRCSRIVFNTSGPEQGMEHLHRGDVVGHTHGMTTQRQLVLQIRSRLALRDKTQKDLGEALGLSHTALSARMNGHRDFTITELEKAANFLGVRMTDLLAFEQEGDQK